MRWDERDLDEGPVPLWFQIRERLRTAIAEGEFASGDTLPPESALMQRFGVSRTTARAALNRLTSDGLVKRKAGRGTTVLPPKVDQPLNLLASFSEDMKARGLAPSYRTLDVAVVRLPGEAASALGVNRGTRAVCVDRLLLADGVPIASSQSWLEPGVVPPRARPEKATLDGTSLYRWIEDTTGVRIARGEEYIEAGIAGAAIGGRLDVAPDSPVLIARRLSRAIDSQPVEYVVLHYRADRYRFRVELARP
jgi:GntR family transcriptional regulator